MAETDTFPLDPDFDIEHDESDGVVRQIAEGGRSIQWQQRPAVRTFTLPFKDRSTDDVETLRDWKRRFAASFFALNHKTWVNNAGTYLARKFPVEWLDDTLPQRMTFNDTYDFQIRLREGVGRALPAGAYPDPTAGHPSFFREENDTEGAVLSGTWTQAANANAHGGAEKTNTNLNTTDAFQWFYVGYGFGLWFRKGPDLGIFQLFLDGVSLGNVDLYAAGASAAARNYTKYDVALGLHLVKLVGTNTKNAGSTAKTIIADALEVLP